MREMGMLWICSDAGRVKIETTSTAMQHSSASSFLTQIANEEACRIWRALEEHKGMHHG